MVHLLIRIAQADEVEIEKLLEAVLHRYGELFPEWEISTISLQKNDDRNAQLDRIIALLQAMKRFDNRDQ